MLFFLSFSQKEKKGEDYLICMTMWGKKMYTVVVIVKQTCKIWSDRR